MYGLAILGLNGHALGHHGWLRVRAVAQERQLELVVLGRILGVRVQQVRALKLTGRHGLHAVGASSVLCLLGGLCTVRRHKVSALLSRLSDSGGLFDRGALDTSVSGDRLCWPLALVLLSVNLLISIVSLSKVVIDTLVVSESEGRRHGLG